MKTVFIAVFLMLKINAMAQAISLTDNGLSLLELNSNIKKIKGIQYDRIENYPNIYKGVYDGAFLEYFTYYYVVSDCVMEGLGGIKKDIFFACDTSGKIRGIYVTLQNATDSVKTLISSAFGPTLLFATSGIGAHDNIRQKTLWNNGKASVFFKQEIDSDISEIYIHNTAIDEKSPFLSTRLLYKNRE